MTDVSTKESLFEKIDRLKVAVGRDVVGDVYECLLQILSTYSTIADSPSIIGDIVKPIHDLLLAENIQEQLPELVSLDKKYISLFEDIKNIRSFMLSLANGDLTQKLILKGYFAGVLKTFHANLKHLTWQTEMVSRGDFTQRVHFMGVFASSFNAMVEQLDSTRKGLIESEKKYRLLAITDSLTGLPNRHHFFEVAMAEFSRAKRYTKTFSVIMLDIDFFKKINDSYGHYVGDRVLQTVAEQIQKSLRETDFPGRYGGEEFIVLLPETAIYEAELVAERIRCSIENNKIIIDNGSISVTASLGIYNFECAAGTSDVSTQSIDEIIDRADKALYLAKNQGRNRVALFSNEL
ncbi:MAG: GGDEF domain-containing protein [Holophagaceae bacterium]|nr:GGDEF domain-containing protein [Holophagaceae bacterium]